jgi:hypothetical protein
MGGRYTIPPPHANSFAIGTAVINTHTSFLDAKRRSGGLTRSFMSYCIFRRLPVPTFASGELEAGALAPRVGNHILAMAPRTGGG